MFGCAVSCEKTAVGYGLWKSCCELSAVRKLKVVWLKTAVKVKALYLTYGSHCRRHVFLFHSSSPLSSLSHSRISPWRGGRRRGRPVRRGGGEVEWRSDSLEWWPMRLGGAATDAIFFFFPIAKGRCSTSFTPPPKKPIACSPAKLVTHGQFPLNHSY